MLDACPEHGWSPKRGPSGSSAKGLCPGCTMWADIKGGRVYLDPDDQPREGSPRSKDPEVRRHIELGLVSDGPPVSTRPATPLMDELWSQHQARQRNNKLGEERALIAIESARKRRARQEHPRKRRVRSQSYQDGRWVIDFQPPRPDPIIFDVEDWD